MAKKKKVAARKKVVSKKAVNKKVVKKEAVAVDPRPQGTDHVRLIRDTPFRMTLRESYARAAAAYEFNREQLMKRDSVLGVDIGRKLVGGLPTGFYALRIFVAAKKASSELKDSELLPEQIDGVPVDVICAEFSPAAGEVRAPDRIAPASEPSNSGCTTALVVDDVGLSSLLLTCAHVVAGSQGVSALNDRVQVVSPDDQNKVVGLSLRGETENWIRDEFYDCALLELQNPSTTHFLPGVRSSQFSLQGFRTLTANDVNVTTLFRPTPDGNQSAVKGKVVSIKGTHPESTGLQLRDHILVEPEDASLGFAERGHSGQLIFADDVTAVGMVRAVDDNPNSPLFRSVLLTPIFRTMNILGISFAAF